MYRIHSKVSWNKLKYNIRSCINYPSQLRRVLGADETWEDTHKLLETNLDLPTTKVPPATTRIDLPPRDTS